MFSPEQVYCVLDFETFSEAELKKVGSFEYSVHPSTEILCAAYRIGTRETLRKAKTQFWMPLAGVLGVDILENVSSTTGNFGELYQALMNPSIILVAHNALFEQVIVRNVFATKYMYSKKLELQEITPSRWVCTAALAAALALPRKLEHVAKVLNLSVQKDMEGNRLVQKWSKPRRPSLHDPSTRHSDPEEYKRLVQYCVTDVDVEVELFLKCPPLIENERKVWLLDQTINLRGFQVDRPLVKTIMSMIAEETKVLNQETVELTGGALRTVNQRDGVLRWLKAEGVFLPDLTKKTIEDVLNGGLVEGNTKRLLEIRQMLSKTSTAKYSAFEMRSRHDDRLRDNLIYHSASTGRWGGAGIQPQNFPRGSIKDTIQAAEICAGGDLELVRLIYGDPMNVFSSCLRGMIVAPAGKVFDVADYNAIEARVLFWVAKHETGLRAFIEGRDLYKEQAAQIFRVPMEKISQFQRFVGKQTILGCGYQMGPKKFVASCAAQGQLIPLDLAEAAVKAYRAAHKPVVKLWEMIGRAATAATENPGKKYTINHTSWFRQGEFLFCQLPSGRRLAYHKPSVSYEMTPWGDKRPVLRHWGTDSKTKKWVQDKTYGGKLVENVVQAIARDLMASAMLRIEAAGWPLVLSIHDELGGERHFFSTRSNKEFCLLMAELPMWAEGLPVKVEGWEGKRYRK